MSRLPELDVTPEEKKLARLVPSEIARPHVERALCRERQLSACLTLLDSTVKSLHRLQRAYNDLFARIQ